MDHQERARAVVRTVIGVRVAQVDGEVVIGIRIHQAWRDRVEALRRLAVALPDLRAEIARPAADRIGLEQRHAAALVFLPDLELGLFLEDADEDRGFLAHVPTLDLRDHLRRERLERAQGGSAAAVGVAAAKHHGSENCRGRQQRAHQWATIQTRNSPDRKAIPSLPKVNDYRLEGFTARQGPPRDSRFSMPVVNE